VHAVGYARALEMCLTGRRLPADECLRIGLANAVVPVAELTAAVTDLVAACLAPMRMAVVETKALLQQAYGNDLETQRALERAAQARRFDDLAALLQST
jgi:enoyl-CoA hydratase/carnithine racemase